MDSCVASDVPKGVGGDRIGVADIFILLVSQS